MARKYRHLLNELCNTTTSWVASTYKLLPSSGNVKGLLSNVPLVLVLCCDPRTWLGIKGSRGGNRTDHWDRSFSQPCDEFLDVSDPKNLPERRPEGGVIPEVEVKAARIV